MGWRVIVGSDRNQFDECGSAHVCGIERLPDEAICNSKYRRSMRMAGALMSRTNKTNNSNGQMILIAGPYRSGTGDDPEKMHANVRLMEAYALPLFRAGHVPVLGEWFALPLVTLAGSR